MTLRLDLLCQVRGHRLRQSKGEGWTLPRPRRPLVDKLICQTCAADPEVGPMFPLHDSWDLNMPHCCICGSTFGPKGEADLQVALRVSEVRTWGGGG